MASKKSKKKIPKSGKLLKYMNKHFSLWMLALVSAAFIGFFAFTFASGTRMKAMLVYPGPNYTVAQAKPIQFVTKYQSPQKENVLMQVAWRSKDSAAWYTFGTDNNTVGPNGTTLTPAPKSIQGGYYQNLIDASGRSCVMGYGPKTPPKSCSEVWSNGTKSGKSAWENTNIYFPTVTLPQGSYEWSARAFNVTTGKYSNWLAGSPFTIGTVASAPEPANPIKTIIDKIIPPKPSVTIYTFGTTKHGTAGVKNIYPNIKDTMLLNQTSGPYKQFYVNSNGIGLSDSLCASKGNKPYKLITTNGQTKKQYNYDLSYIKSNWKNLKNGDAVQIGCAAGCHRSVTLAIDFKDYLVSLGYKVTIVNVDYPTHPGLKM